MNITKLPTGHNYAQQGSGNRIPRSRPLHLFVRFGAILVLAGLLVSSSYLSSSASFFVRASKSKRPAFALEALRPTGKAPNGHEVSSRTALNSGVLALSPEAFPLPLPVPQSSPLIVATYASDCSTPKTTFNLQDADKTVCAKVSDATPGWQVIWSNANFVAVQTNTLTAANQSLTFTLTPTSSRGDWRVIVYDPFGGSVQAVTSFAVVDSLNPVVDLLVSKAPRSNETAAGAQAVFAIQVGNRGPDNAAGVQLTDAVPANTTFVSFTQLSGPVFSCSNPVAGEMGTTTCTVGSLNRDEVATFLAVYLVDSGAAAGTEISNTANISTSTTDNNDQDDASTAAVRVAAAPCTISCPSNITQAADSGQAGAIVTYSAPTSTGDCGQGVIGEDGETIPPISCSPASGSFFSVGTTTVICFAQTGDACSFQVSVENPGGLSISLNGPSPLAVECGTDFNDPGASAVDGTGQSVPVTVTFPLGFSPDAPAVGSYIVTYTATQDPNSVSTTRTVNVSDSEAPAITIDGANPYRIQQGSCTPFTDPGVSANDGCAGSKPVSSSISGPGGATSVNPSVPGTYTVTYTATDGTHEATATRTVLVGNFPEDEVDQPASANVPPTITLTCPTGVDDCSQTTIECGDTFTDLGATASVCGSSVPVTTSGTVDRHTPGVYSITYTATANNLTATATRTVTVEPDNTAPTITLTGANPIYVECHTGTFIDPGAIAHDACAGDFAAMASGSVNVDVLGSYTITYNATDPSGHAAAPVTRTVIVRDTTPPTVTAPANVTVNTGPGNTSCSVTVSDATLGTASASDSCQGTLPTTRSAVPSGNVFTGTTTITYSATDASNNTGTATQTVTVVDTTPPTISCQADIVADFNAAVSGAVVTFTAPVGVDNCSATTTQIAGLPSGATFPVGTTTDTFRVTDAAGNTAQCSFKVTVALTSIIGLDSVTITGSAFVDSYNSTGGYPATKGSLANILSNGTITMGNSGKVWGNVRSTRVNVNMTGASQVTGNATAGTTVTTSGSATVGGIRTNNALAPFMTLPSVPACGPPYSPNSGISGTYSYNATTGNLTLSGVNIATLANGTYCFNNVTMGNSAQLKVNGPVVIKLTGTLNTSGATNLNNTTQIPSNLRILSSYTGNNGIILGNSANVYALIYAPNTGVNISGSAPLFGTVAGKTITMGNSGAIHYDTQLKSIWPAVWTLIFGP